MDGLNKWLYNKNKLEIEVIDMSQLDVLERVTTDPSVKEPKKIDVTAIRRKLAVTTLPGSSLVELYKEGK
ncbi:hypothetical protein D1B31_13275 [Neobacillus notoginsengisoli]|uniref:Uncharacterized protein n=1 Tax=Neobacillus notoginsengisoli TaxID=1578198 RepID=A0A417YSG3_9BACI|nr:hypothetical protein [Neobacillus notoginsengisoli]RHW38945.1 hypothetical protein D1B31_13275 [Neobacillus notoginsengisoli]